MKSKFAKKNHVRKTGFARRDERGGQFTPEGADRIYHPGAHCLVLSERWWGPSRACTEPFPIRQPQPRHRFSRRGISVCSRLPADIFQLQRSSAMALAMELSFRFSLYKPRLATVSSSRPLLVVFNLLHFDNTANLLQKHLCELFLNRKERENSLRFSSGFRCSVFQLLLQSFLSAADCDGY